MWSDTEIEVPGAAGRQFTNAFTGETTAAASNRFAMADLGSRFPSAVLILSEE
ncbi:MAG: hypothetical protein QM775_07950 [Pirellulales bacterium]